MSGGLMIINKGKQRNLHWHTNANEWHYYLRGKGQVALFGSGGRSKIADVAAGDAVYIPAGFGHAIKNTGDDDLEVVQTWDNGKFEEIDLDNWVRASPNYLLTNNFSAVPASTIGKMKET
jgi:oxalate decarboxylase